MHIAFVSALFERFQSQDARLGSLLEQEKRAVLTLMHSVALVDGELAMGETEALKNLSLKLGINMGEWLGLPEAMSILSKNPRALKLAALVIADSFFVDGSYDDAEQKFVENFAQRFQLPENPLREAVESLRKLKLEEALNDWNHEINSQEMPEADAGLEFPSRPQE